MKVIFLDIDGVLNSWRYDQARTAEQGNIDETRLPLLHQIVSATGAIIVLTSSWRKHWERDFDKSDAIGQALDQLFRAHGLAIYDKTIVLDSNNRTEEVRDWLDRHEVEAFVIIDDISFGWEELQPHLVKTNHRIGRGLNQTHVAQAIAGLGGEV